MAKGLLDGDTRVWVKIDNMDRKHIDATQVYKPSSESQTVLNSELFKEIKEAERKEKLFDIKVKVICITLLIASFGLCAAEYFIT